MKKMKFLLFTIICAIIIVFNGSTVFSNIKTFENTVEANVFETNYNFKEKIDKKANLKGYKVKISYLDVLEDYYLDFVSYCLDLDIKIEVMSFKEFHDDFYSQDVLSISEYVAYLKNSVYELIKGDNDTDQDEIGIMSSSGSKKWYYNTGVILPQKPKYEKFDFSFVWVGDILFEDAGGPGGLTGHIAIIEGNFYDTTYGSYWRVVESIDAGVCRGVLDDDRFVERQGYLLCVPSSTSTQRQAAVNFCIYQLGKPWSIQLNKPTSINTKKWQCSTMVWAAYKNQGIDIEQKGLGGGPGITPNDIRDASTTSEFLAYK